MDLEMAIVIGRNICLHKITANSNAHVELIRCLCVIKNYLEHANTRTRQRNNTVGTVSEGMHDWLLSHVSQLEPA